MYYRLKDRYILRGWQKLSSGIVDLDTGMIGFLPLNHYRLLKLCNGTFDFNGFLMTDDDREVVRHIAEEGILDESESQMDPLSDFQQYRKFDNRLIRSMQWSITGNCNYKCRHCYMSAPHGLMGELTLDECREIIRQMADCGIFNVQLTGGEPLVHPHFWEIVDLLLENHIKIHRIYSNGFLINRSTLDKFDERGIKPGISMSFDGTEGWHEWLRNVKGADRHIVDAFRLCRERGFATDAEMCLHKGNIRTIRDSVNFLASLGCSAVKINRLSPEGEAAQISDKFITIEERNDAFLEYIPQYLEDGKPISIVLANVFRASGGDSEADSKMGPPSSSLATESEITEIEKYCLCGHARNSMYLTSEGRMLPCIPFSNSSEVTNRFEKISDVNLKEALNDSYYFTCITKTLGEYLQHNPECRSCEHILKCKGGCRGLALDSSSEFNLFNKDMDTCLLYKKGYYDKVCEIINQYEHEHGNISETR